ncbi:hypothetical protein LUX33_42620 [Actinomadura madurae]|uniref:hypothetical protein n=1 Tax=Actinomadura madurae TaxID=1993 RepID=UPI0020D217DB|nr:hypothetical protein [Actinomadura madurae]MCP9954437.1 hypothetical protein [Actinomadura madurae]
MTTVILVVMCVVVGALELYAGKQSRDQANAFRRRIDELNDQVTKQNNVLVTVGEQLTAELSRVKQDVLPALDNRLRQNTGQVEELAGLVHQADDYLRTQANRLHELEQQRITLAALRRKLGEVETSVRAVTRTGGEAVEGKVDAALGRSPTWSAAARRSWSCSEPSPAPWRTSRTSSPSCSSSPRASSTTPSPRRSPAAPAPTATPSPPRAAVDPRRPAGGHPLRDVRAVRAREPAERPVPHRRGLGRP